MTQSIHTDLFTSKEIAVDVLRLDLLHPQVSGNKWFKLKYHLHKAKLLGKTGMVSFGGAYSNHLVAMAFLCKSNGLGSTGIVRGEEEVNNASLDDMRNYGMNLVFVNRETYRNKDAFIVEYLLKHPGDYYVPEGGAGALGIEGAGDIMQLVGNDYTHVACAVGTGTTFTGLINAAGEQKIIGVYCVKLPAGENSVTAYVHDYAKHDRYELISGYEFGGFGKKTDELVLFMNALYEESHVPTDIVYTGKLFYGVYDLLKKDHFPPGSRILVIHSGGLQGNRSLPLGLLRF